MDILNGVLVLNFFVISLLLLGLSFFYNYNKNKKKIVYPDKKVLKKFEGFDYPESKKSGVGGGIQLGNPLNIKFPDELKDGIFS